MGGADWILFILLSLLWLASGGIPINALRRGREPGTRTPTSLPPREEPTHTFSWPRLRRKV